MAQSATGSSAGETAGGVFEVFDEVGLIIAILAAVVLAALLLTALFVALLVELVLAMVLLIVGVVWRVVLRRPWTVEAVRQATPPDALETIVVEPVVVDDDAAGSGSGAGPATGAEPSPDDAADLPWPDVATMPDDTEAPERRGVPVRLAWRVVGWRASGALRRTVAEHLQFFGHRRFVGGP